MARSRAFAVGLLAAAMAFSTMACGVDRQRAIERRRTAAFEFYAAGERLEREGAYEDALREYRAAVELSERPGFLYRVGLMHQRLGDPGRAVVFYDRAIELAPDYTAAIAQREIARTDLAREESAAPHVQPPVAATSSASPAPPPPATIERRQPDPAMHPVEVIDGPTTPAAPEPVPTIATPYERLDPEAVRAVIFPELVSPGGWDIEAERARGRAAMQAMRWSEAAVAWGRVADAEPADPEAALELAKALQRTGRQRRALEQYAAAARLDPESIDVRVAWGNALVDARRPAEAEVQYREGLRLDPDNVRILNNLAALCLEGDRPDEAVQLLRLVLEIDRNFLAAFLNLALALDASGGSRSEAISSLETYLRLDGPRREEAERWLVRLRSQGVEEGEKEAR